MVKWEYNDGIIWWEKVRGLNGQKRQSDEEIT